MKLNHPFHIENDINWEYAAEGITRQIFGFNNQIMMVKVKFEKGAVGVLHQHIHTQASYVESGIFEINIDGDKKVLKAGDGFFVEPNLLHGALALEAGILIDVFNPMRADFI
jgi:quercetin dioxygenase-like cupin family protein